MKHGRIHASRRRFLKQGVMVALAGGVLPAGALMNGLAQRKAMSAPAKTAAGSGKPARVYVFASDPRAALSGFQTIPG